MPRETGETRANQAGENAMFKVRGKELLTCLLADLLWNAAVTHETPADELKGDEA